MRTLIVSAEVEPLAKVGGLADVAGSLPRALKAEGIDVRVLMPAYAYVLDSDCREALRVSVEVRPGHVVEATVYERDVDGLTVWLLAAPGAFDRVTKSEELYSPGRDAYLFLSRALPIVCDRLGWRPDVVHANDWHTGFVPVVLRELHPDWGEVGTVFTIHNLAYQGVFGRDTLDAVGLPQCLFDFRRLETWGAVNFLKAGCAYSDEVNTVSPSYALEIQGEAFGCGLEGLMRHLALEGRLHGILNGIDVERHDPSNDPALAAWFSDGDLAGKALCKAELQRELALEAGRRPLFGVVSRLSEQKGFDLMTPLFPEIVSQGGQVAVLGTGGKHFAEELDTLAARYPGQVAFAERYDAPLAQRIYAGSDAFLMPSRFEPCGLGQMFAMRYGTLPIVRRTGGLADSVEDGRNGFVFEDASVEGLRVAVDRAFATGRPAWAEMVAAAMRSDFSWKNSARRYAGIYRSAGDRRDRLANPLDSQDIA